MRDGILNDNVNIHLPTLTILKQQEREDSRISKVFNLPIIFKYSKDEVIMHPFSTVKIALYIHQKYNNLRSSDYNHTHRPVCVSAISGHVRMIAESGRSEKFTKTKHYSDCNIAQRLISATATSYTAKGSPSGLIHENYKTEANTEHNQSRVQSDRDPTWEKCR
jgi:hypothetical protein